MGWRKGKQVKRFLRLASQYQTPIFLALVGLALIGIGLSISKFSGHKGEPQFIEAQESEDSSSQLMVDVAGAVKKPGIYTLEGGSRIIDAIEKASGFSGSVDEAWVAQNLNLAAKISDGQKIYIPKVGQRAVQTQQSSPVASQTTGKINVNTASEAQLDTLPGIGPAKAAEIISGRPYRSIEDLLNVKGIGESTLEKIKDKITVY